MSFQADQIGSGGFYKIVRTEAGISRCLATRTDGTKLWADSRVIAADPNYVTAVYTRDKAELIAWALNNPSS